MTTDTKTLNGLLNAINVLRQTDESLTPPMVLLLLTIARHPGLSQVELAQRLELSTASVSYGVATVLMLRHGLVKQAESPDHRSKRLIYLTTKGERLVASLLQDFIS
jgi:DNA-binding MarR family transcriptional regulator